MQNNGNRKIFIHFLYDKSTNSNANTDIKRESDLKGTCKK